jgi:hypothetical protein
VTAPAKSAAQENREENVRLSIDEPIDIDVTFCDVCRTPAGAQHGEPLELRFRGQRHPDGKGVRVYVPLGEVEGELIGSGALKGAINTTDLPAGPDPLREISLDKHALTITKYRKGNGVHSYRVRVRRRARLVNPEGYLQALRFALDKAVPELTARGFSVGASDVISIAGQVMDRPHQQDHHTTEG